ncbi:uncharacterized protein LOC103578277 [Microplitis demolitor]|uniref:uncharacterized protein LOC103578277 n=1 Tax=Microplitis demolitor TaxID=69319 RepID=UPI0006D4F1AC|nr:uncharacterized protein LOC103578277 [Microplitis demolitor]
MLSESSHSSRYSSQSNLSDLDETVNISQIRQGLSLFRKKIIADVKKFLHDNCRGAPTSTRSGKVKIDEILLDAKYFLRALSVKKMRLRANRLMRAYWSDEERDRLITRKNKRFPMARIVSSQNYNDLIHLCYSLQKRRFLPHTSKHNPDKHLYQWVIDFLKVDQATRKKQKETEKNGARGVRSSSV